MRCCQSLFVILFPISFVLYGFVIGFDVVIQHLILRYRMRRGVEHMPDIYASRTYIVVCHLHHVGLQIYDIWGIVLHTSMALALLRGCMDKVHACI